MELIDKATVVSEIESLMRTTFTNFDEGVNAAAKTLLESIDTLEVKEGDYERELSKAVWADKHPKQITLSAADRGIIDEIIFALSSLGKEKMISYHKEIEFLNKIRKL